MSEDVNQHFKQFAQALKDRRATYGHDPDEEKFVLQRRQLEGLGELEEQFRLTLIRSPAGREAYKAFVEYICTTKRNVLAARPFFRERQQVFTDSISDVLKERNWRGLFGFHINYQFVHFAVGALGRDADPAAVKISKQIEVLRKEIVETNLPLAIARAKMFWSRTPKSHLSFMDFVQIATEGLVAAIDKFVLPYTEVFRCVAIGRMLGNFIEAYSDTMLHFYPTDRRKVYRANKYISKNPHGVDYDTLSTAVNEGVEDAHKTTASEIYNLVSAVSYVSANTKIPSTAGGAAGMENISQYAAPEELQPDKLFEETQATVAMREAISRLSLVERKLLKLRGIDLAL